MTITDKTLFVSTHSDDMEISCLGAFVQIAKDVTSKGKAVHILNICHTIDDDPRWHEQKESERILKAHFNLNFWLERPTYPFVVRTLNEHYNELRDEIEDTISRHDIKFVFAPFPLDTHIDHRTVGEAATDASRKCSLIYYEAATSIDFIPNMYMPLSEEMLNYKTDHMLECFPSQCKKNDNFYVKKIKATAAYHGQFCYAEYAEAYQIKHINYTI
ncbi:MAG TPA: PIG-L family deacetylase [Saccharofermentans sp.]|nr:PIG-L family deacetylase [Saccharofermentans sp.]